MTAWQNPSVNTRTLTRWERQQFHNAVFAHTDRCAYCGDTATIADHIIPLAAGGTHDPVTNGQPLCAACDDTKSKREAHEGRIRANGKRPTTNRKPEPHPGIR